MLFSSTVFLFLLFSTLCCFPMLFSSVCCFPLIAVFLLMLLSFFMLLSFNAASFFCCFPLCSPCSFNLAPCSLLLAPCSLLLQVAAVARRQKTGQEWAAEWRAKHGQGQGRKKPNVFIACEVNKLLSLVQIMQSELNI